MTRKNIPCPECGAATTIISHNNTKAGQRFRTRVCKGQEEHSFRTQADAEGVERITTQAVRKYKSNRVSIQSIAGPIIKRREATAGDFRFLVEIVQTVNLLYLLEVSRGGMKMEVTV